MIMKGNKMEIERYGEELFKVINTKHIDGQWLEKDDVFLVICDGKNSGYLIISEGNTSRWCKLTFYCPDIIKKSKDEILSCIHEKYHENTFRILNEYVVDLI